MNIRGILRRVSAMLMAVLIVIGTTPVSVYRAEGTGTATLTINVTMADVKVTVGDETILPDSAEESTATYTLPIADGETEYTIIVETNDPTNKMISSVTDGANVLESVVVDGKYSEIIKPNANETIVRDITLEIVENFYDYTVNMNTEKGSVTVTEKDAPDAEPLEGIVNEEKTITTFKLSDKKDYIFTYSKDDDQKFDTVTVGSATAEDISDKETHSVDVLGSNLATGPNVTVIKFYSDTEYEIKVLLESGTPVLNRVDEQNVVLDSIQASPIEGGYVFKAIKGFDYTLEINPEDSVFEKITINEVEENPITTNVNGAYEKEFDAINSAYTIDVDYIEKYPLTINVENSSLGTVTINDKTWNEITTLTEGVETTLVVTPENGNKVSQISINDVELTTSQVEFTDGVYTYSFIPNSGTKLDIIFEGINPTGIKYSDLVWTGLSSVDANCRAVLQVGESATLAISGYDVAFITDEGVEQVGPSASVHGEDGKFVSKKINGVMAYATGEVALADTIVYYQFENPLTIVCDGSAPEILPAQTGNYWYGKETLKTTISVTVSDENTAIQKVVYFVGEEPHNINSPDGELILNQNNTYTLDCNYSDGGAESTTYHIYAINESGAYAKTTQVVGVDNEIPVVTMIQAKDNTRGLLDKLFSSTTKVTFVVEAQDMKSGVNSISLDVISGEEKQTYTGEVDLKNNGKAEATFEIVLDKYKEYTVVASVKDNVKNVNDPNQTIKITDTMAKELGGVLYVDTDAPAIFINSTNAVHTKVIDNQEYFYIQGTPDDSTDKPVFEVVFGLSDFESVDYESVVSGIASYEVTINGYSVQAVDYAKYGIDGETGERVTEVEEVRVATNASGVSPANKYIITLSTVDVAGNQATKTITVIVDRTRPTVASLKFGDQLIDESTTDYVFFSNDTMSIEVNPEDSESGIQSVEYWLDNKPDEKFVVLTPQTGVKQYNIKIDCNSKGVLHVKTMDNVGLESEAAFTCGVISEEKASDVTFTTADTPYVDATGKPLYTNDTKIKVDISDNDLGDSGIKFVEWTVTDQHDNTLDNGKFSVTDVEAGDVVGWTVTKDGQLATELTGELSVASNSNHTTLQIKVTDNAGNTGTYSSVVSIDKTNPVVEIGFDNTLESGFYTARTATITVYERNFDANKVIATITNTDGTIPTVSEWTHTMDMINPDKNKHTATISFVSDGDYTLKVDAKDMGNRAAETVEAVPFTVDKTAPTVTISYDNNTVLNEKYYAAARTATVTVTEHNFDANSVVVNGTATFGGGATAFPSVSGWSSNGDVHTTTLSFSQDALFKYDVNITDKAGNAVQYVENEFSVDTTIPEITITGVEDMSANNGTVAPIVTITDENYDANGVTIELIGANQGRVEANGSFSDTDNGQVFNFADFAEEQSNDDLYTLMVTEVDKAGNTFEDSITFSVNRFGSVYTLSEELAEINGKYVKEAVDVVITETNVDGLDMNTVKVVLTTNGNPRTLVRGDDYTISQTGGGGSWSQYEYRIGKEMFKDDGAYSVAIYSVDDAGNVNENINETKEAEVFFGIDTVNPIITAIDLESGKTYEATAHNAVLSITDNLVLGDVSIMVNGEPAEYTVNGTDYSFVLEEASSAYTIVVSVTDKAGNAAIMTFEDVWVTTSAFVRVMNSPVALAVGGGAIGMAGIGVGAFIFLKNKNVIKVKRK